MTRAVAVLPPKRFGHLCVVLHHLVPFLTYPCRGSLKSLPNLIKTIDLFSWSEAEISGVMDNNVTGGKLRRSQVNVPGGGAAQTSHSYFYFHNRAERKFKGILRGNHDSERNPIAVLRLHYLPNPTYRLNFSQPEISHIFQLCFVN